MEPRGCSTTKACPRLCASQSTSTSRRTITFPCLTNMRSTSPAGVNTVLFEEALLMLENELQTGAATRSPPGSILRIAIIANAKPLSSKKSWAGWWSRSMETPKWPANLKALLMLAAPANSSTKLYSLDVSQPTFFLHFKVEQSERCKNTMQAFPKMCAKFTYRRPAYHTLNFALPRIWLQVYVSGPHQHHNHEEENLGNDTLQGLGWTFSEPSDLTDRDTNTHVDTHIHTHTHTHTSAHYNTHACMHTHTHTHTHGHTDRHAQT